MQNNKYPFSVAIVGAGPAGIYAAEALLKRKDSIEGVDLSIDIIEVLSSPYGLVRSGVAPDHFKIKDVSKQFDKILSNEKVSLKGNIQIGRDLSIEELRLYYDAIILAHGTQKDRALGIPGENIQNSYTATSFVGWYNSHPWFFNIDFDLSGGKAVIIGQGNVAIDVARILLKPTKELHETDIGAHAVEALEKSNIKDVYLIGRRGPLQIACTDKELKELGTIDGVQIKVRKEDLKLNEEETKWLEEAPKGIRRNYEILKEFSEKEDVNANKTLHFRFLLSPVEILGEEQVACLRTIKNTLTGDLNHRKALPTEDSEIMPCEILLRSVGYLGEGINGLPFDKSRGVYPNKHGRVIDNGIKVPGVYTSGWIKRGPSGVIGTNKADSVETVQSLIEDVPLLIEHPKLDKASLWSSLKEDGIHITDYKDWKTIEQEELRRGEAIGKKSLKFRTQEEMLSFIQGK